MRITGNKGNFLNNSILIFVGVNLANLASYLLYILLLKYDKNLFNDYIPISSIVAILFTISLIIFRAFAVDGQDIYTELSNRFVKNKSKLIQITIIILISSVLLSFLLSKLQDKYSFLAILLTIITALASYVYSMYRGIRQYDGDLTNMIIGINIETFGRLLIGFTLGYFLKMGIEGILLSMIIAHLIGIFYMYKRPVKTSSIQLDSKLLLTFRNSFIFTLGLELYVNILILYANTRLQINIDTLTNFNSLEFFRKTVMLSIVAISGYIISTSAKQTYSKRFIFLFTLISGTIVAGGVIATFYIFKEQLTGFLNLKLDLVDPIIINVFFLGTIFSAIAYLIANWLFSFQRKVYIYMPMFFSIILVIALQIFGLDFNTIITTFTIVSSAFLIAYLVLPIFELHFKAE